MAKRARTGARPAHPRIPEQILERLPENRLLLYAHLWELETWLREMVYVELSARYGSGWTTKLVGSAPSRAEAADRRLHHMPTREKLSTSYILFSQLQKTISRRWLLFREYLPPKEIWKARISEIDQIRNRVAHFRQGHPDDINRVREVLRDIDRGFWIYCTSYNHDQPIVPIASDPVAREFAALDPFPWAEVEPKTYVRLGHAPDDLVMSVTVELLRRPWLKARQPTSVMGHYGYFYDVCLFARQNRSFDYGSFLERTSRLHHRICHICLDRSEDSIRITIPSVAGREVVLTTLRAFVKTAEQSLGPRRSMEGISFREIPALTTASTKAMDELALQWPEYVLGPSDPLTFLAPGMPCKFFGTS